MNLYSHFTDGEEIITRIPGTNITYPGIVSGDSFAINAYVHVYDVQTGDMHTVHKNNIVVKLAV